MKTSYPKYKRGEVEAVYKKLSDPEKKIVDDFATYCEIRNAERKVKDMRRNILQFRDICQTPFEEIDLETLRGYLALLNKSGRTDYTTNGMKVHIKYFLKWKFIDWSKKFGELRDIKGVLANNEDKINEQNLLSKEDVEKVMKKEDSLYWKTFFMTLYESGLRPGECAGIKWSDVNFKGEGEFTEIHILATKTKKARMAFVKEAVFYLERLKEERTDKSEFVFPSPRDKSKGVQKSTICMRITKMCMRALKRKVFPYLLRHSRAHEVYTQFDSTKTAAKFMGHSKDMGDLYAHINSSDVKEALNKTVYQVEDLAPEEKSQVEALKDEMEKMKKENKRTFKMLIHAAQTPIGKLEKFEDLEDGSAMRIVPQGARKK